MLTKSIVVTALVQMMAAWAPPDRSHAYIPEAKESVEAGRARYATIAESYLEVAFDEQVKPLVGGRQARLRTAAMGLGVALFESGFRRDVHLGIGRLGRGDGGRSWCLMQINIGKGKVPTDHELIGSWYGKDLVADTRNCARAGFHLMARSISACAKLPWADRLSAYTTGKCQELEYKSRQRMRKGLNGLQDAKITWTDEEIFKALKAAKEESAPKQAEASGTPQQVAPPAVPAKSGG